MTGFEGNWEFGIGPAVINDCSLSIMIILYHPFITVIVLCQFFYFSIKIVG